MSHEQSVFRALARRSLLAATAALAIGAVPAQAAGDTTRVIVAFKPGAAAAIRGAVSMARGSVQLEIFGMDAMAVEVPTQALNGLARNPNVEYIEEDVKRYPLALTSPSTGTPYATGQLVPYGIQAVQADLVSDAAAGERKVCIIDSGYDRGHEDLANDADVSGEFDSGTGWWYTDENGHGTHVAGTISALNNAGTGVVGVMAGGHIKLHIVKVFGANGWAYSSTLASAANKCGAAGSNIISMSLGGSRANKTEERAFNTLHSNGVLSIAAAGNAGTTARSYPASYANVLSVAAVDQFGKWATFSQYNTSVDIAGPGVGVLSTVPRGTGSRSLLSVGATSYAPGDMEGSPKASASGALFDFGIGNAVNAAASGKVCLIARGTVDFATKVANCQNSGGVAAVVYNNVAGGFGGTLGTTVTTIPSVTASDNEGTALREQLGQSASVAVAAWHYAYFDGTSMATPHVAAVAAMVWSLNTVCTNVNLRASLLKSAKDLETAGYDNKTGAGLVQAKTAHDRIQTLGCGN